MKLDLFSAQSQTISIAVTTTASVSRALPALGNSVRLAAIGAGGATYVAVSIGAGTRTATLPSGTASANSTVILLSTDSIYSIPADQIQNISAICDVGTATLFVAVGEGT